MVNTLVLAVMLPLLTAYAGAQDAASGGSENHTNEARRAVLEVTATNWENAGSSYDYVYLRVFSDHTAEAELVRGDFHDIQKTSVSVALPEKEVQALEVLLADPDTQALQTSYSQRSFILDSSTHWEIRVFRGIRGDRVQRVGIVQFAPDKAKRNHEPYPDSLLNLGCTIEKLRAEVTRNKLRVEDECKRVFRAQTLKR